jgi:hypothetical protein
MELILLAMPPACMLLASASSRADWVTDKSSRSLKLLPILGVPSLPSLPFPLDPGLRPLSSAVRLGDKGPACLCREVPCKGSGRRDISAAELVEESEVCEWFTTSTGFL